jgi:hypothetical protein
VNYHPVKRLTTPYGYRAGIDIGLVPLIKALWAAGYETGGCCQDLGESAGQASDRSAAHWKGYVLLEMPVADACRLLDAVKVTPQFKDRMHWAAPGAWSVTIPVLPSGFSGGQAGPLPWAQIHFPADQADELANAIRAS